MGWEDSIFGGRERGEIQRQGRWTGPVDRGGDGDSVSVRDGVRIRIGDSDRVGVGVRRPFRSRPTDAAPVTDADLRPGQPTRPLTRPLSLNRTPTPSLPLKPPRDAKIQERPSQTARAMLRIFPADLPISGTPPENSSLATHGERAGNRVSRLRRRPPRSFPHEARTSPYRNSRLVRK